MMGLVVSTEDLSLSQKAAIVMMALKSPHHDPLWDRLSTEEVLHVTQDISQLGLVPSSVVAEVLLSFLSCADPQAVYGGHETASLHARPLPVVPIVLPPPSLWSTLRPLHDHLMLASYLEQEDPHVGGFILSEIPVDMALALLETLTRPCFLACLPHWLTPPVLTEDVVEQVQQHFSKYRSLHQKERLRAQTISQHMSVASVALQEKMLEAMRQVSPPYATLIATQLLSFAHIFAASSEKRHLLSQQVDKNVWSLALIPFSNDERNSILGCFSDRTRHMMQEDLRFYEGHTSVEDIKNAQKIVVSTIHQLMNTGVWTKDDAS